MGRGLRGLHRQARCRLSQPRHVFLFPLLPLVLILSQTPLFRDLVSAPTPPRLSLIWFVLLLRGCPTLRSLGILFGMRRKILVPSTGRLMKRSRPCMRNSSSTSMISVLRRSDLAVIILCSCSTLVYASHRLCYYSAENELPPGCKRK